MNLASSKEDKLNESFGINETSRGGGRSCLRDLIVESQSNQKLSFQMITSRLKLAEVESQLEIKILIYRSR